MGTRRLRLFVVAYLRGLLKPYYENGNLSIIREELLLKAISSEFDMEAAKQVQALEVAMAQNVKDKSQMFSNLYDKIVDYRFGLEFSLNKQRLEEEEEIERLTNDPEINKLIHTVNKMVESGEWDESTRQMNKEIEKDQKELDKREANPFKENPNQDGLVWQWGSSESHPGHPNDEV